MPSESTPEPLSSSGTTTEPPGSSVRRRTALLIGTGVVAGAVLAGVATAGATTSSTSTGSAAVPAAATPSAGAEDRGGPGDHRRGGRLLHGTAVVRTAAGALETVADQVGDLTAVSATSITVKSTDGFTATYAVTKDTRVRIDAAPSSAAKLGVGKTVRVDAVTVGGTSTARRVSQGTPPEGERGGPGGRHHGFGGPGGSLGGPPSGTDDGDAPGAAPQPTASASATS